MGFVIQLVVPRCVRLVEEEVRIYDNELDDVRSIIHDVCSVIHDIPGVEFRVAICSDELWPVTVDTDLCVVMEQLPDVIRGIKAGALAKLDFYEQGIEQSVAFRVDGSIVVVECRRLVDPDRHPKGVTVVPVAYVLSSLCGLATEFVRVGRFVCPVATSHPWFVDWCRGLMPLLGRGGGT
ncbi:hypothetical protein WMF31_41910 [Sorangium sp. So ce1036]|nr:hypothetical protein [Sorangium cellulosum]